MQDPTFDIINKNKKEVLSFLVKNEGLNSKPYHLSLSFNVGGLKPLLDIRNSALIG
jgi:hypothetical protein